MNFNVSFLWFFGAMCILLINGGMLQTCFCPVVTTHKRTLYIVRFTKMGDKLVVLPPTICLVFRTKCVFLAYTHVSFSKWPEMLIFSQSSHLGSANRRKKVLKGPCLLKSFVVFFPDEKNSFSFPSCPSRSRSFDRKKVLRNNFFCLSTLLSLSKMCPTL